MIISDCDDSVEYHLGNYFGGAVEKYCFGGYMEQMGYLLHRI